VQVVSASEANVLWELKKDRPLRAVSAIPDWPLRRQQPAARSSRCRFQKRVAVAVNRGDAVAVVDEPRQRPSFCGHLQSTESAGGRRGRDRFRARPVRQRFFQYGSVAGEDGTLGSVAEDDLHVTQAGDHARWCSVAHERIRAGCWPKSSASRVGGRGAESVWR